MTRIEPVPTSRLKVDSAYQRPLNEQRVKRMAAGWNDDLAGVITVSARNGSWYVADGQHRLAAAREASVPELMAVVHEGLTPADEARLYIDINLGTVRPRAVDLFRARLELGQPDAVSTLEVAQELGMQLVYTTRPSGNRPPGAIGAVATVYTICADGGRDLLHDTLLTVQEAWPEDPAATDSVPLLGIASFIWTYQMHPRYRRETLADRLSDKPVRHFTQRARTLGEGNTSNTNVGNRDGRKTVARFNKPGPRRAALEAYNRRMRNPLSDVTLRDYKAINAGKNPWVED